MFKIKVISFNKKLNINSKEKSKINLKNTKLGSGAVTVSAQINGHENKIAGNNDSASTSLWIGNVDPNVSEETLTQMFATFGPLTNVRCLPEKYCAFVNFKIKDDAQKAMLSLQVSLETRFLVIH